MATVDLTWQNLSIKASNKTIVHESSGYCQAGTMLAIMGSSGSGKTTLLSAMAAQRLNKVFLSGKVNIWIWKGFRQWQLVPFKQLILLIWILRETK